VIHYHGTPITPRAKLIELAGRCFCVSYAEPRDIGICHEIGQSVMLDNGAFSAWKRGHKTDWSAYYEWSDRWLDYPTTWAVIPDEIDAGGQLQDALISEWPHGERGAPVYHMDERPERLLALLDKWPRVCIGSTAEYAQILTAAWERRMDELWNEIAKRHSRTPNVHMLRGMQLSRHRWPFASVDSTDVGQNSHRDKRPRERADRWDATQCPPTFIHPGEQLEMVA
jgi:hypothetical protein